MWLLFVFLGESLNFGIKTLEEIKSKKQGGEFSGVLTWRIECC